MHETVVDADGFEALKAFSGTGEDSYLDVHLEGSVPPLHVSATAACTLARRALDDSAAPGPEVLLQALSHPHRPHAGDVQSVGLDALHAFGYATPPGRRTTHESSGG